MNEPLPANAAPRTCADRVVITSNTALEDYISIATEHK